MENAKSSSVSYTFTKKYEGYLVVSYYTHYPPETTISFDNSSASCELINADNVAGATASWGGYSRAGVALYKINVPPNTEITAKYGGGVTVSAVWVIFE